MATKGLPSFLILPWTLSCHGLGALWTARHPRDSGRGEETRPPSRTVKGMGAGGGEVSSTGLGQPRREWGGGGGASHRVWGSQLPDSLGTQGRSGSLAPGPT